VRAQPSPAFLALALLAALVTPAQADPLEQRVRILHTTDLHGTLAAWDDATDRPAARGLERLATLIDRARGDSVPTLLLDAGDALSGSPLVRVWREHPDGRPEPVTAAMNALGYDALALGNHEFDAGRAGLDAAAALAHFPFLGANVVDARTGRPAWGATLVREVAGVRIGIVGLSTPAVPQLLDSSLVAGLAFLDPLEVASAARPSSCCSTRASSATRPPAAVTPRRVRARCRTRTSATGSPTRCRGSTWSSSATRTR